MKDEWQKQNRAWQRRRTKQMARDKRSGKYQGRPIVKKPDETRASQGNLRMIQRIQAKNKAREERKAARRLMRNRLSAFIYEKWINLRTGGEGPCYFKVQLYLIAHKATYILDLTDKQLQQLAIDCGWKENDEKTIEETTTIS